MKKTALPQWVALTWMIIGVLFFLAYMLGLDDSAKNAIMGVYFMFFGLYLFQQWDLAARNSRVSKELRELRNKTDMLLKHAGLTYDPKAHVPAGVLEAIAKGDKIAAIKCYREATEANLAEAKLYVEEMQVK